MLHSQVSRGRSDLGVVARRQIIIEEAVSSRPAYAVGKESGVKVHLAWQSNENAAHGMLPSFFGTEGLCARNPAPTASPVISAHDRFFKVMRSQAGSNVRQNLCRLRHHFESYYALEGHVQDGPTGQCLARSM